MRLSEKDEVLAAEEDCERQTVCKKSNEPLTVFSVVEALTTKKEGQIPQQEEEVR